MANFNKVILIGNLTRDPVLKYLPSGTAVCEFGLAVNRTWKDSGTGERREATTFVDCKAMGRQGEVLNQYMSKGRSLFVEGRLDYRSWEAQDGSKRSKLDVFVENFQFLGGREGAQGGGSREGGRETRSGSPGGEESPAGGPAPGGGEEGYRLEEDEVPF